MSLDLNIQENIWKMISHIVYDQKQYNSADSLRNGIQHAVSQINNTKKDIIKEIYNNFNSRLLKVIENKGNEKPKNLLNNNNHNIIIIIIATCLIIFFFFSNIINH